MKTQKLLKKLLCLLTVLAMTVSMFSTAFATTLQDEGAVSVEFTDAVAEENSTIEEETASVMNNEPGDIQEFITGNDTEYVTVASADELEEALQNGGVICLVQDFELDRTFYITSDTYIYSDEVRFLTRAADFGGDIFVVGEYSEGTPCESTVTFILGNPESDESNLLTIDGNGDNMSVDVTGSVVFVCNNAWVDLYKNITFTNNKKLDNERILDKEKYGVSYPEQVGGAAVILASGTLNVYGSTFSKNIVHDVEGEASSRGGAIYSFGALNIYGADFDSNSAARGGAIYNYNETHIYNANFTENSATYRGGAIYLPNTSQAKLFLGEENDVCENNVVFDSNTSVERGGAIFGYGTINVNNSQFTNNTSTQSHGGAIVADGRIEGIDKTLTVSNSVFENNSSYFNGGAVYLTGTDASFCNVEFSINTAYANANASGTRYGGGAVYSTGSTSEFDTVTFTDNHSDFVAGALAFYSQSVAKINGITAASNSAESHGGAIYINKSEVEITESDLKNNQSAGNGGALYTTNATVKITDSDFTENEADTAGGAVYFNTTSVAELATVSFIGNKATEDSGAVKLDGGSTAVMNRITAEKNTANMAGFLYNNASVLDLYNSTITENMATLYNAGALYSDSGSSSNIYKTKFLKNSATGNGGALYMYTDTVESIIHSCTFSENVSGKYGGVMYASNKSIVKMYNTIATDNEAANGGFLYETTTGTTITMAGLTVSGNTATVGGPIIWGNSTGAVLNLDKAQYFDADHTGGLDDAYWATAIVNKLKVNDVSVTIPGYEDYEGDGETPDEPSQPEEVITINIQSATQLEQAIKVGFTSFKITEDFEIDRTFYITEDTHIFSDEAHTLTRAADFAGDIFVVGENSNGAFTENPVTLTFGNPESDSENLLVIDGNKDNLSVSVTGTVFFIGNNSTVNVHKNVTVKNNKKLGNERTLDEKYAASYPEQIGGAAAIIDSGTLNIYGSKFTDNIVHDVEGEASSRGGAIYSFGTLNIYGADISENSAARGGAIYSYKTTNIYNASITKNSATYRGGAIYMPASANSRLTLGGANEIIEANVLFEENSAADNGGAIFDQGILNVSNTTFSKNTSEKAGGAITAYGVENLNGNKSVTVSGSVFDQNTSAGGGAVALYSNATAMFSNTTFANNTSSTTGGAVVADSADVKVYGSTFENNTASSHGGALIASNEAVVYMSNVKANGNSSGGNGGAMYSTASKIEIDGAEIKNNSATSQGGAFSMHRATATGIVSELTFNKITASGNTAGAMGGFLYNNHSVLKMYNSDIKDNYSTSHGGAISLQGVADTSIYNTKFTNNSCGTEGASTNGGAMYVYPTGTNTILHSCTFDSNSAPNYGGGLYVSNGAQLEMYNTTAKNNTAPKGGFMYETTTGTVVTMSGLTVSGNTASVGGPIIWGNTTNAKLRINKSNYTDLDHSGEYDSTYWASAIVNKLSVEETADEVPRYQDYNNELYDEYDEVMDVSSASELEFALGSGVKNIRIVESFEVDRTFYITGEVVIFTTASKTLTRKPDFAGDIFVVGEDAEGNSSIELGKTAKLTLGNQYSDSEDFLIIDGNSENMTVAVTGTVLFLEEGSQIDLYKGVTIQNNRKIGNDRILKEKYLISNANRVGGAAMIISDGTVNIYGAKLKNNVVNNEPTGEGVTEEDRISYLGGAIYTRGTFNIHSGLFEGNVAGRGGVIYNNRDLKIYGGKFIGNHASTNGGAVYLAGSQFSQMYAGDPLNSAVSDKILFKDNTSVNHGGALYCAGMAIAMIYGDTTFDGNRTDSNGGAIATYGMVDTNNVVMKNNYAYNLGGAAYIANSNDDTVTRIVTFENTLFEENTARNGGAVAVYASSEELSEGGILEVQKCNFIKNKAVNTRDTEVTSNVFGGAIYITRKSTLNIEDSNFEENEALFEGGAIYSAGESETTVNNSTFKKNTTTSGTTDKGGAVSVHSAYMDFDTVTFEGNSTTTNGGAIYVSYTTASAVDSKVDVKNSIFTKNNANGSAGAIYVTHHIADDRSINLNVSNTRFEENTATEKGGAILLTAKSNAYMKDVEFIKNATTKVKDKSYGGAIYVTGSNLEIDGANFTQNKTDHFGGAMSIHGSANVVLNDITATENSALQGAGFLFNSNGILAMYNSEIKNNTAGASGGAIALMYSAITNIHTTLFEGNSTKISGGAVYAYTDETETVMHSCTLKNNHADSYGGGIYASNKTVLYMYNIEATGNNAEKGGFMYETVAGTNVTINTLTVDDNTAISGGPIIYGNSKNAVLNIHKMNYTDLDDENVADESYWDKAIVNELIVNDLSGVEDEIPDCDTYIPKESEEEEEEEKIPVPVDDVLSLGQNSDNGSINSIYDKLPRLDTSSNFMSKSTTLFENINGSDVTVDSFIYHQNEKANNCTVGEGILIYQAILYKQAHPEEEVNISIASFRFSTTAAVCINRNSRYFGYMRNLSGREYDKYGFVRISYLLVTAAKMGINVTVVGQLNGYPQLASDPTLDEYFNSYLDELCDPAYAEGKVIGDYLTFGFCEWTSYDNKAATDMMHTKMCAVSHYLDMNGVTHKNAVWSSSSNLDGVNASGTNGNSKMQTATIVSDHEEIYRASYNYINIIPTYCGQEDVYNFRTRVADMTKNQIDLIEAGRGNEINPDEQIVYLGTENDDVFELYFSPFGGDVMTWTEAYNPYCKYIRKFSNSDDYVTLIWNSANYNKSTPIVLQLETMITNTFTTKKNPNNKIYTNLEDFDTAPYKNLVVGEDIGYKSFNKYDFGALHSKDLQLSYSENGKREYVSILSSINMHGGAMSYQSNYVLVIKEDDCDEDSVFFNIADQTSVGIVEHTYGEEQTYIPENENEDGYTYVVCEFCHKKVICDTVHRPGEWIVAKEATVTTNGIEYRLCKGCGKILEAKETIGREAEVKYEGVSFNNSQDSKIPLNISAMPKTFEATIQIPKKVTGRGGVIVSNYEFFRDNSISLEIAAGGKLRLYYRTNGAISDYTFDADLRSDIPKHIALTIEGLEATLYVDGTAAQTKALQRELPETYDNMYIGGDDRVGNSQFFKGKIYSVSLFGDVRTAEEVNKDAIILPRDYDELLYSENLFSEEEEPVEENNFTVINSKPETFAANKTAVIGNLSKAPKTFEATIKVPLSITDRGGVIVSNYDGGTGNQISLEIYTYGHPRLFAYTQKGKIDCIFNTDIRSENPRHISVSVEGRTATLYVDGAAVETKTLSYELPEALENFKIGGDDRSGNKQYFRGEIYSVALFEDARTPEEIKKDMSLVTSDEEGLVYTGYFAEEYGKTVLKKISGRTFDNKEVKGIYDLPDAPHTFEAVVNVPVSIEERAGVIVGNYKAGLGNLVSFEIYSGGRVRLYYKNKGVAGDCIFDTDIRSDNSRHIVVSVESDTATLYVDGVKVEEKTLAVPYPEITEDLKVGGDNRIGNTQYFKGKIYSVALYSHAKTEEDVTKTTVYNTVDSLYSDYYTKEENSITTAGKGKTFTINKASTVPVNIQAVPYTFEATVEVPLEIEDRAGVIVGNYKVGASKVLSFEISTGGRPRLYYKTGEKNVSVDCVFDADVRTGKPVHVAIAVEGLEATLYINGVKTQTKTLDRPLPDEAKDLKIGGDNRSGNLQYFKGTIYNVALFEDVRSEAEIAKDAKGVSDEADAMLYNTDFTVELCDKSTTGAAHKESDWIIDCEPQEGKAGLKHKECTACGIILAIKEYVQAEEIGNSMDYTASNAGKTFKSGEDVLAIEGEFSEVPKTYEATFILPKSYTDRAGVVIGNYDGGASEQINIEIYTGGKPRLYYKSQGRAYTYLFSTDVRSDITTNLAITIDGLVASLYLNGELKETANLEGQFANVTSGFKVGADNRKTNVQYFKGTLYSINLFADVRSADEIKIDSIMVARDSEDLLFSHYFKK